MWEKGRRKERREGERKGGKNKKKINLEFKASAVTKTLIKINRQVRI